MDEKNFENMTEECGFLKKDDETVIVEKSDFHRGAMAFRRSVYGSIYGGDLSSRDASPLGRVMICFFLALFFLVPSIVWLIRMEDFDQLHTLLAVLLGLPGLMFFIIALLRLRNNRREKFENRSFETLEEYFKDEIDKEVLCRNKICPTCSENHDLDYPKCPKCQHIYVWK